MENVSANLIIFPPPRAAMATPWSKGDAKRYLQQWQEHAAREEKRALGAWMAQAALTENPLLPLLESVFGNSPYLTRLLLQYPDVLQAMALHGADVAHTQLLKDMDNRPDGEQAELMQHLRLYKSRLALLVALADIAGAWPLDEITAALSGFAGRALSQAIDTLLTIAHGRGEIVLPQPDKPSQECGIIVLGMGKLGGNELNYSSDIDLIIFFEPGRLNYQGKRTEQHFMTKLAHDLVTIMQERTALGYVFRTDLRLRPDPASTPPAISTGAAYYYYESVGQNWERAAMIKARPIAGDIPAGERFLRGIAPFMWRRNLDFAAINDIHSIKRQMDNAGNKGIQLKGHNIKLGMGGIREIEFYTQIHQLIWGGRQPNLRSRATCLTLSHLAEFGLIDQPGEELLVKAYEFLRKLEHRLQMVADEQTHSLPDNNNGIAHIACFMGYNSLQDFERDVMVTLEQVHAIYASSFRSAEALGEQGNLVFTGVSHDPDTLETLRRMGYSNPETISEIVMGWHHGSRRATRTKRARELLTELMPILLKRLSETVNPDAAFLKFNEFLTNLPVGVQLFSLFSINPHLLGLIADIMGSAPTLADTLSKSPDLLESVLYADFYDSLPSADALSRQLDEFLAPFPDFEDRMEALRRFRNERQFQAGVQLLKRMITAQAAASFLSLLADAIIARSLHAVENEFARAYGRIKGSQFAVIALGKLGSQEMTFGSDIDLVFVYDLPDTDVMSDGEKPLSASVYFNRFSQRFLGALSAMGRDGKLYDVDIRLRPSGDHGLPAVSTGALAQYFQESAWTFEYMAFTKARVVALLPFENVIPAKAGISAATHAGMDKEIPAFAGMTKSERLGPHLEDFFISCLTQPRDNEKLRLDVLDMRERIGKEHGTDNPWDLKYVRGGLVDIDFIAQYLVLRHAPATPGARPGSTAAIFDWLRRSGRMEVALAEELLAADRFMGQIFNMLRLCCDRQFDEESAPPGLKKLLVESLKESDFLALKKHLIEVEQAVHRHYLALVQSN